MQPDLTHADSVVAARLEGVSIVIPVYNEVASIEATVEQVSDTMRRSGLSFEIILVNDGSTDGTAEKIAALSQGSQMPFLRVKTHRKNRGYGASLKTGYRAATFPLIAITDADGTYPNERIPELVRELGDADMVIGARVGQNVKIPLIRKPAKWAINQLANYLSETSIPDLNSGLRIMRRDLITRFLHILPDGFSFTTTITLASLSDGYDVKFIPIDYYHRAGNSKISPIQDTIRFTQLVVRTVMYFNPLRVFVPFSLVLFTIGLFTLLFRLFTGEGLLVVSVVLFMAAIQVLTTGMIADLINKTAGFKDVP